MKDVFKLKTIWRVVWDCTARAPRTTVTQRATGANVGKNAPFRKHPRTTRQGTIVERHQVAFRQSTSKPQQRGPSHTTLVLHSIN